MLLRDIHNGLLTKYDWKDSVSPPTQPGVRARPARDSQDGLDGVSQCETAPLFLPQLYRLHEDNVRVEDSSNVTTIRSSDGVNIGNVLWGDVPSRQDIDCVLHRCHNDECLMVRDRHHRFWTYVLYTTV